jgi:hypothetical protein
MTEQRFRVGIVGLEPGRGWAARAHVPALRALSDGTRPARGYAHRAELLKIPSACIALSLRLSERPNT